jgi:hypothetical protein
MPRAEPDLGGFVSARRVVKPTPSCGEARQDCGLVHELPNRMDFELAG